MIQKFIFCQLLYDNMNRLLLKYLRKFPIDRGKKKISWKIDLSKSERYQDYTNSDQIKFSLDLEEYQMREIFLFDIYEKNTIRHIKKLLRKIKSKKITCVDVGANIGFYSLTIAKYLSNEDIKIHSFEPNPVTLDSFERNLNNNPDLKIKIKLNNIGLSDKKEVLELFYIDSNKGAASVYSGIEGRKSVEINLDTLDNYCTENRIKNIDFLKVDIEGAEMKFLLGAEQIIEASEKMILIMELVEENCTAAGYASNELFNMIIKKGFKAYLPKSWPQGIKEVDFCPINYHDNIIFLKGY